MLKCIDQVAVAQYIAFKNKPETLEEKKVRADMKEQKAALIEALNTKCRYARIVGCSEYICWYACTDTK